MRGSKAAASKRTKFCKTQVDFRSFSLRELMKHYRWLIEGLRWPKGNGSWLIDGFKPKRTCLILERADLRPKKSDLKPERVDMRPEREDLRLLRPSGGTDKRMDKRINEQKSPHVLQDFVSFGAAAQKALKTVSEIVECKKLQSRNFFSERKY